MLPLAYKILIASSTSKQLSAFSPHPRGRKYAANHIKIDAAICHIKVDVDVILAWFKYMRATRARLLYTWRTNTCYRVALKSSSSLVPRPLNFGFLVDKKRKKWFPAVALPRQSAGVRC